MRRFHHFTTSLFAAIAISACSSPDNPPTPPSNHSVELRVAVRNFVSDADNSQTEAESAIRNLSLFLFDADGREVVQPSRQHSLQDDKVLLHISTEGVRGPLKAYAVANETSFTDAPVSETELLDYKTRSLPSDFLTEGLPMSSGAVTIQMDSPRTSTPVTLERVPSAMYVQVDAGEFGPGSEEIRNNSYRVEVEGLQMSEGALFQDVASSSTAQGRVDYSPKLTAVNTPENVAYFYQSPQIKIHVTPRDPKLGETKTVTIEAEKSRVRNKKFLITIKPVKAPPADNPTDNPTDNPALKLDFGVSVSEWGTEVVVVEIPAVNKPAPPPPGEDVVLFAEGVNVESGWYDQNKSFGAGGFSGDWNLCWACVETNMIQWWQDRYVADGHSLPGGVPNGFVPGRENAKYRQMAIFEEYYAANFPDKQGHILVGIPRYFTHYFPDIFKDTKPFFEGRTYARSIAVEDLRNFSDFVVNALKDRGVVSLGLLGHVTTLWGVTYNTGTGLVKNVYMSDSDDKDNGEIYVGLWKKRSIEVRPDGRLTVGGQIIEDLDVLYAYPGKND